MASADAMPLLEDDTIAFGEEDYNVENKRPGVTFFHLFFRVSAIIVYILCGWFSDSFIASFVTVVLLLSMDFWTVKNITGRLMVGLRWWNYVDDEGKSHWVFEAKKNQPQGKSYEKTSGIFWTALILTPLVWSIFFLIALFGLKLKWLLLVVIALALNGANLYGYIKCKLGHNDSIANATTTFLRNQVLQNALSKVIGQSNIPNSNPVIPPTHTV